MDLNQLDVNGQAEEGAVMQFHHPLTGEPLFHEEKPMQAKLKGTEFSATFRNKKRNMLAVRDSSKGNMLEDEELAELYGACTSEFMNIIEDGKLVKAKNAHKVYLKQRWMLDQVTLFMAESSNFFTRD